MLSRTIPLFPLPNVVLFPNVFLPLHIFEPRYRAMVADALEGDRMIGIVLLKPGWEEDYEGRPPVYPIGGNGLITHAERLPDGCYNIVLRGLEKFRIVHEAHEADLPYRRAHVEVMIEDTVPCDRDRLRAHRQRLEALVVPAGDGAGLDQKLPITLSDEDLVHALAQYLALEPLERQALLERDGVRARCESLLELLEMRELLAERPWYRQRPH
ncbi:MAG TPA: LON peptidase substrate-binding domain-containing protein [Vicinamibacterales bacterium]|nr:LON peptidase substrate-binding domain-containing protein [Vicinamibacterales bacterium]